MTTLLVLVVIVFFVVAVAALVFLITEDLEQERATLMSESARADETARLLVNELAQRTISRLYADARER